MVVQCEACQTRFRLADEKIKPGGIKVRCSKCKEIFTVTPPEPEPVEEAVDFGDFNMEKVTENGPGEATPPSQETQIEVSESEKQPTPSPEPEPETSQETSEQPENSDLDFSTAGASIGEEAGGDKDIADDFSFADTSQELETNQAEEDTTSPDFEFSIDEELQKESASEEQTDFNVAAEEAEEANEPHEFDFGEDTEFDAQAAVNTEIDFAARTSSETSEFSFENDEEKPPAPEKPDEISFDEEGDDSAFSFDEEDSSADAGEFSFDDESSFSESASEWDDETSAGDSSFDFEEPSFDKDSSPSGSPAGSNKAERQFGEIDFANDGDESTTSSLQPDDDFSVATMERQEESEPFRPSKSSTSPSSQDYNDEEQISAPSRPKKSSLSRILVLLVLLLVVLGSAAGYLFMQEGSLNLQSVAQYLPFLKNYVGEAPTTSPGDRIGIPGRPESNYVDGKAGQMLVIQGAVVNNYPTTRSAITVKGVLLDAEGKTLLQQTVFCGNKLDETALKTMSFAAIEEAMNNQFGDGLSNMNVSAGTTIPFTIVFRNLPEGIANINVEVVDSKPGSG